MGFQSLHHLKSDFCFSKYGKERLVIPAWTHYSGSWDVYCLVWRIPVMRQEICLRSDMREMKGTQVRWQHLSSSQGKLVRNLTESCLCFSTLKIDWYILPPFLPSKTFLTSQEYFMRLTKMWKQIYNKSLLV
jgi:hypothetical protein